MRPDQSVHEMVEEVLERQSRIVAERSGCSPQEALAAVLDTRAGRQLSELKNGPHAGEKVSDWQEDLLWERALERLDRLVRFDAAVSRSASEGHYSWLEGYLERLEGKEARMEYYVRLEEERAGLRG